MALAIILSIFVGLVVSLFFILDHSRRSKAKKAKRRKSQRDKESTKNEEGTYFNSASMIIQSNFLLFFRRLNDFDSGIILCRSASRLKSQSKSYNVEKKWKKVYRNCI